MAKSGPEKGISACLDRDVLYLNLSPRLNEEGLTESVDITPRLIIDLHRRKKVPVGIEVFRAAEPTKGIIDLSSFKPLRGRVGSFGSVSPEQVLQVVDRIVKADEQASQNPTVNSVVENLQERIDLREARLGRESRTKGTIPLEQLEKD